MVDVSGSTVVPAKATVWLRKPNVRKEIKDVTVSDV